MIRVDDSSGLQPARSATWKGAAEGVVQPGGVIDADHRAISGPRQAAGQRPAAGKPPWRSLSWQKHRPDGRIR